MCMERVTDKAKFCVVQHFNAMKANNQLILTDKDCPLLLLSKNFMAIHSSKVLIPVSLIHECDSNCSLKRQRKRRVAEREEYEVNSLSLCHDYKRNNMFVVNVYCMNNADIMT